MLTSGPDQKFQSPFDFLSSGGRNLYKDPSLDPPQDFLLNGFPNRMPSPEKGSNNIGELFKKKYIKSK